MNVSIRKLRYDARMPKYGSDGAGCFDLYAATPAMVWDNRPAEIGTGLSFMIPPGFVMLVFSRSGHGFKHGVRLSNCVGVIDSDYRGEVMVKLHTDNAGGEPFPVHVGDRIAQAMLIPAIPIEFEWVEQLDMTARGFGGFGSTGA